MAKFEKILEKTERVTKAELLTILLNFEKEVCFTGCSFANVVYFTDESGSRTVNKQKALQKLVRTNVTIGSSYEKRINRDLEKRDLEENFTAQAMTGKEHVTKMIVQSIKNPDFKMLCCVVEHHVKPDTIYFQNGRPKFFVNEADKIESNLFMPSYFAEKTTSGRGNMSVENDFHFFTLGIDKIKSLRVGARKFIVED